MGYERAGFEVVGVDLSPQPHYPFEFHQADALSFSLEGFDAIHASPPCQAFTRAQKLRGRTHPELIEPIRERLFASGAPFVIENVPGAPLKNATLLCGLMFGLALYRHRIFETSWALPLILHPQHHALQVKMGRPCPPDKIIQVVGHFSGVERAKKEMQTPWMSRDEMAEAIPPVYTEWIGGRLIKQIEERGLGLRTTSGVTVLVPTEQSTQTLPSRPEEKVEGVSI